MLLLLFILLTYLVASLPTGLILCTLLSDVDIRQGGSGNIGTTNVARLTSAQLGLLTLAGDITKGLIPVLIATQLSSSVLFLSAVVLAAFVGHCWSAYLNFQGGKGVATVAGAMLPLAPTATALTIAIWIVLRKLSGRSSVASLVAVAVLSIGAVFTDLRLIGLMFLLSAGIVWRHKDNIQRLRAGEE